jgi:membrane protein involved in colicin uptake
MGLIDRLQANTAQNQADRAERKASKLADKNPEKAARYREAADRHHRQAEDLHAQDDAQKVAKLTAAGQKEAAKASAAGQKDSAKASAAKGKAAAKADLAGYRAAHPLESQLNKAAMMHLWPKATHGSFPSGPVRGAHAELFNANAHKGWTASRLASNATAGVASGGLLGTGRKNKGSAQINIQLANGVVLSHGVKPQDLAAASRYVMSLNAYSEQLTAEDE